jgi:hypothetical protein
MTDNCKVNDCQKRLLVAAIEAILLANSEFCAGMSDGWEGDPLQDACDAARDLVNSIGNKS